jgi:hypothetical protein
MSRLGLNPRKAMRASVESQPLPDATGSRYAAGEKACTPPRANERKATISGPHK